MRRVVVTGLGVVSPLGIGRQRFFSGLHEARSGIDDIRSFDASAFPTRIAGEVKGLEVNEARLPEPFAAGLRRDRKSLFGWVAAQQALADAFGGEPAQRFYAPRRISVLMSTGLEIFHLGDIGRHVREGRIDAPALLAEVQEAPLHARLQIPSDLGIRAIARSVGARGLVSGYVSACAAGTQAIGEAWHAIRDGAADVVVTGGYDSMVNPLGLAGFCLLEALSRSNALKGAASRPFDARRDGFVLGEGSGVLVLEELQAARRRGAPVLAEVLGYGASMDAYRVTDPAPDHAASARAMAMALSRAGLSPSEVGYINAHGTGTRKNDPSETQAIRAVFGAAADKTPVSSTKSQMGHLIGAAGAVEFIAGLFALLEGVLPATVNLEEADPECDLDYVPGRPRQADVRVFLSNSFGFGGQNASVVAGRFR